MFRLSRWFSKSYLPAIDANIDRTRSDDLSTVGLASGSVRTDINDAPPRRPALVRLLHAHVRNRWLPRWVALTHQTILFYRPTALPHHAGWPALAIRPEVPIVVS